MKIDLWLVNLKFHVLIVHMSIIELFPCYFLLILIPHISKVSCKGSFG